MSKILIVEDEIITIDYLEIILRKHGHMIFDIAQSGEDALDKVNSNALPDLILMDISLEGELNGIETAKILTRKFDIPIIFLTALSDKESLEDAKEAMPYGYIIKPFDENKIIPMIEMVLYRTKQESKSSERIKKNETHIKVLQQKLENYTQDEKSIIEIGGFLFDVNTASLYYENSEIKLTRNEKKLITLLLKQLNQVVSIDTIEHYIWPEESVKDNTLRTLIWRLRKKVGDSFIENCNSMGYKIVKTR